MCIITTRWECKSASKCPRVRVIVGSLGIMVDPTFLTGEQGGYTGDCGGPAGGHGGPTGSKAGPLGSRVGTLGGAVGPLGIMVVLLGFIEGTLGQGGIRKKMLEMFRISHRFC